MKKMLLRLLLLAGLMTWGVTGCSNHEVDTAKLQTAFQSQTPEVRAMLDKGVAAIQAAKFSEALTDLQKVAYAAKMDKDQRLILEDAIYSVIPPEGCAAILWRDAAYKSQAAEAMRISAPDVHALGCVDDIVPEPPGGAHTDPAGAAQLLAEKLRWHLNELQSLPIEELLHRRYDKFRNIAQFYTV